VFDSDCKRALPSGGVCRRPGPAYPLIQTAPGKLSAIAGPERNQTPMSTVIHFIGLDVHKESSGATLRGALTADAGGASAATSPCAVAKERSLRSPRCARKWARTESRPTVRALASRGHRTRNPNARAPDREGSFDWKVFEKEEAKMKRQKLARLQNMAASLNLQPCHDLRV
jgi:hypothetical protein